MTARAAPPEPAMPGNCQITVAGPLSAAASRALGSQFGPVLSINRLDRKTVLDIDGLDQPSIRGLLTLLWDLGHDIVAVDSQTKERLS